MKLRPSEIKWPKRIRQDFGDLTELRKSIAEDRLGAPVTVNRDKVLVDGGRRLKAWKMEHGDESIECFVYEGSLDPVVMEIKMEAMSKKFTPDEIYAAGKVLEDHYEPSIKTEKINRLSKKEANIGSISPEEKTGRTLDAKVAKDLGIDRGIYRSTKRLFEPEVEEKIGKQKAEELRQIAREKGITPAYNALKDAEYKANVSKQVPRKLSAKQLSLNEARYLNHLKRALEWIQNPPGDFSDVGLIEIKNVLTEMKSVIEEVLNA